MPASPDSSSALEEITELLNRRDADAERRLYTLLYGELHRLARRQLAGERPGGTIQATALVHELFLRLHTAHPTPWGSRAHFFGAAARAMRRILVDQARRKRAGKRGGGRSPLPLDEVEVESEEDLDLAALDDALSLLEERDPRMAKVVELRFFANLGVAETAQTLGISPRTVKREWNVARAWLRAKMREG